MPTQTQMELLEPREFFSIAPFAPVEISGGITNFAEGYDSAMPTDQSNTGSLNGGGNTSFGKEFFTRIKPHINGPYRP